MQRDSTHQPVSPEAPCEALCLVEEPGDVADAGALLDEEEDAGQAVPHARRHRQPRELPLHDGRAPAAVRPDLIKSTFIVSCDRWENVVVNV